MANWIAYGWAAIKADDAGEARTLALLQEQDWNVHEVSPVDNPARERAHLTPVRIAWASVAGSFGTLAVSVLLKAHTGTGLAGRILNAANDAALGTGNFLS